MRKLDKKRYYMNLYVITRLIKEVGLCFRSIWKDCEYFKEIYFDHFDKDKRIHTVLLSIEFLVWLEDKDEFA